ncbi:hypothetical protein [Pseudomonas caspiana]|uniref:Uncharacterized protein n=1 Tax=Pseudomonas caspiana TaxID=1451454 RepID=A0A1Y3NY90_9PSED|nr:hypothetical protein [Pseudomonas caspiana]OUM72538.1 hypothetical protein AUC60_17065 [Pseudomonas caspiana]
MNKKKYAIIPVSLLERISASMTDDAMNMPSVMLELQALLSTPTELHMTQDLRFILSRPNFGCQATAQVLRGLGHYVPERTEDEQAATIHWLLNHYLRDPHNWRINSLEEFNAAAALLKNAADY